jgi:subtilisin-like proprotein convertase family protein
MITQPASGASHPPGTPLLLQGTGFDPEDGGLDGRGFEWTSDRAGPLGNGASLTTSELALGRHRITLRGQDSGGNVGTDVIDIIVEEIVAAPCTGDCEGTGFVTIADLIKAVNVALGTLALEVCPAIDDDKDGIASIDELISAVNHALGGCPGSQPTPPPSRTPTTSRTPEFPGTPTRTATATLAGTRTAIASPSPTPAGSHVAYCHDFPRYAIPSGSELGLMVTIDVPDRGTIADVDVRLEVTHTWVGDLIVDLEHESLGRSVRLLDRPGGDPLGCPRDDIAATFDDAASRLGNDECAAPGIAIEGRVRPIDPLDVFAGDNGGGRWTLTVTDPQTGDFGTLQRWCVEIAWLDGA